MELVTNGNASPQRATKVDTTNNYETDPELISSRSGLLLHGSHGTA